jgi:tetratricopeptide (TPR) repeat protein
VSVETAVDHKKKIAADCFRKGNDAMEKRNFDYAVKMHSSAVQLVPDNLMFRQTLRGCERYLYGNNKKGARFSRMRLRLKGIRGKIRKARSKSDWTALDQAAEAGLTLNPWNAQLNADMGDACFNLGYTELAEFGFKNAVDNDPENRRFLEKLGDVLELRGNYSQAIDCWKKISKLFPNDGHVRAKITGLEASRVMDHGGYEGAKTTQEVKKTAYDDYRPTTDKHVPEAVAGPGVSVEADLQRAIRKNPADKGSYLKLAEIYRKQKEFDKAADVLQKAFETTGSADFNIRQIIEDVELERRRHEIELARSLAKDEAGKRNMDALKRELHQREIEILSTRVERYPMDAGLKYELAMRHMKSKEYKKAIPLLQQATVDQRREARVRVALGKCFIAEKQAKLARYQFEKSAEKMNAHDDPQLYCEAHYILGRLCEDEDDRDKAEKHYSDVLSVDYNFKDARARLERLQKGGGGAPGEEVPGDEEPSES